MNTDLYTKTVLTVIALCLVWMCVNGAIPVARAQAELPKPTPVVLVNEKGFPIYSAQGLRVNLVNEKGLQIYTPQGIRVNLGSQPLPVTTANNGRFRCRCGRSSRAARGILCTCACCASPPRWPRFRNPHANC